jgi:hypothetical protein
MIHSVTASGNQISSPVMKYFFSIGARRRGAGPWRGTRADAARRRARCARSPLTARRG